MNSVAFGDTEVLRIVEWVGPIKPVSELFPETPGEVWSDNSDWLAPDFYVPEGNSYRAAIQTWVVRSAGLTVVVDTGVGNDRDRPQVPMLADLHTDYLDRLEAAGVDRRDVDIVVNTHIHYDHVGWNTMLVDGIWEPTFPNATYVVPKSDRDYFDPDRAAQMRPPRNDDERARFAGIRLVFDDSIAPIESAGQLVTWQDEHRITDRLRLEPAPGHTPGSSVLWLDDGDGAVFVGDLMHTPAQLLRPCDSCGFDLDTDAARRSRGHVLAQAARTGTTVFPAHYAGRGAVKLAPGAEGSYRIEQWAPFTRT